MCHIRNLERETVHLQLLGGDLGWMKRTSEFAERGRPDQCLRYGGHLTCNTWTKLFVSSRVWKGHLSLGIAPCW